MKLFAIAPLVIHALVIARTCFRASDPGTRGIALGPVLNSSYRSICRVESSPRG